MQIIVHNKIIIVVVLVVKINIHLTWYSWLKKEGSHEVVMCSVKKTNRIKFNTIVRQRAIHAVGMI